MNSATCLPVPRRSPLFRILSLGLLSPILACALRAEIRTGQLFPVLAEAGLAGGEVPATAGKILVVDFWASWCGPCKASFPVLGKVAAEYAGRGVVLVGISVDEKAADYTSFLKKHPPRFPAFHDAQQRLVRTVQVPTMPTTYIVDRAGRVRAVHVGFHGDASERKLRAEIETLLAEKS